MWGLRRQGAGSVQPKARPGRRGVGAARQLRLQARSTVPWVFTHKHKFKDEIMDTVRPMTVAR